MSLSRPIASSSAIALRSHRAARAFTLVELLVVIAIISLIASLVMISISSIQASARTTVCLANQRQIALANTTYSTDNNGFIVSPRTQRGGTPNPCAGIDPTPLRIPAWVETPFNTVTETETNLQDGVLWPYLGSAKVYLSPLDPTNRVRSYSINEFVGVGWFSCVHASDWFDFPDLTHPETPEAFRDTRFSTLRMTQIPQPSRTLFSITEEDPSGTWNKFGWVIRVAPPVGVAGEWIDPPALWNGGRINFSYVDGSVEAPNLIYSQLKELMQPDESLPPLQNQIEPGSRPAHRFMSRIMLPGVIPDSLN